MTELVQLRSQRGNLLLEPFHARLEAVTRSGGRRGLLRHGLPVLTQELHVAVLALPRPAAEPPDELALGERVERLAELVRRREAV